VGETAAQSGAIGEINKIVKRNSFSSMEMIYSVSKAILAGVKPVFGFFFSVG